MEKRKKEEDEEGEAEGVIPKRPRTSGPAEDTYRKKRGEAHQALRTATTLPPIKPLSASRKAPEGGSPSGSYRSRRNREDGRQSARDFINKNVDRLTTIEHSISKNSHSRSSRHATHHARDRRSLPRHRSGVVEKTETFEIKTSSSPSSTSLLSFETSHPDLKFVKVEDHTRMQKGGFCNPISVDALWVQKNRLDEVFDTGNSAVYYEQRELRFPQDAKGSNRFWNRAGDKLQQVIKEVDLLGEITKAGKGTVFLDVCGGPGAFTQLLLHNAPPPSHGYGMTLRMMDGTTPKSDVWYKELERDEERAFTICWGKDGTGSVYNPDNLDALIELIEKQGDSEKVNVIVADGGFEIKRNAKGLHMENLQELFSGRIILSEVLFMLKILTEGGVFVCKMFDSFSQLSGSLIYVLTQVFERVFIVKPVRSRIVNSERYLVGKNLQKGKNREKWEKIVRVIQEVHQSKEYDATRDEEGEVEERSPKSVVPLDVMQEDAEFMRTVQDMNESIAKKQTAALEEVLNNVYEQLRQS